MLTVEVVVEEDIQNSLGFLPLEIVPGFILISKIMMIILPINFIGKRKT